MKLFQLLRLRDPEDEGKNAFAPADHVEPEKDSTLARERFQRQFEQKSKKVWRLPIYRMP